MTSVLPGSGASKRRPRRSCARVAVQQRRLGSPLQHCAEGGPGHRRGPARADGGTPCFRVAQRISRRWRTQLGRGIHALLGAGSREAVLGTVVRVISAGRWQRPAEVYKASSGLLSAQSCSAIHCACGLDGRRRHRRGGASRGSRCEGPAARKQQSLAEDDCARVHWQTLARPRV